MNRLILSGRLTQDPEMKQTSNGTEMATFNVAVSSRGMDIRRREMEIIRHRRDTSSRNQAF